MTNQEYETFVTSRQRLLDSLGISRDALTDWIELHRTLDVSLMDLATLEGLLGERKRGLEQLLELDERFMLHLLERRKQAGG